MKYLQLTKNKIAIIDDDVFLPPRWSFDGRYAVKRIKNKKIYLHRFLMGHPKGKEVDHINGNKLDCRKENLRICEKYQNQQNVKINSRNKSGYRGISWYPSSNLWRARIQVRNEQIYLGYFEDIKLAVHVYNKAAQKYYGKFARLNTI